MNNTGSKHHFSRGGGGRPENKMHKKNETSQISKSGEASQLNLDMQNNFYLQNILKSGLGGGGGGGSQPEKNVELETLYETRGSVGWACVAHLSFCFEET